MKKNNFLKFLFKTEKILVFLNIWTFLFSLYEAYATIAIRFYHIIFFAIQIFCYYQSLAWIIDLKKQYNNDNK